MEPKTAKEPYDTFFSFSSVDRGEARWLQRFLESWVDRRTGRRLKVFRDETDLRGGLLDDALRQAAHQARTLVVCYSPAAAESRWVQAEVALFREKADPSRIAVAIVAGSQDLRAVGRTAVPGTEVRVHDLRRGRWLAKVGLGARVELLRLLAFVADVDLRTLRNWHLRRTLRNIALFVVLAVVPVLLLLNLPMPDWDRLNLRRDDAPLYAISAEADGDKLLVASRFRGAGPQGFRDYIQFVADALNEESPRTFEQVALRRRVLPVSRLPFAVRGRLPRVDVSAFSARPPEGPPWFCELTAELSILVQPLAPTEEEIDEARDLAADLGTHVPKVAGSLVTTVERGRQAGAVIADLSPVWTDADGNHGRTSPSRGLAVAWSPEGEVWLGMQGRDAGEEGGLWRRRPGASSWERVSDFSSVQSIDLDVENGRTRAVLVAVRHLERWQNLGGESRRRGLLLEPSATQVLSLDAGASSWRAAPAPPFGSLSEVELVGRLAGSRLVRVDEQIFRQRSIPLWRMLVP